MRAVVVLGRGKVGVALARAARAARLRVHTFSAREPVRALPPSALVVLACRDGQIAEVAQRIAPALARSTPVVHCSGSLGAAELAAVRDVGHPVGTMHPLASFASAGSPPALTNAALVLTGDAAAVNAAKRLGRAIGMAPIVVQGLDPAAYHAAAALVANGAAALAASATALLDAAGVASKDHGRLLGPLLRSVGENVLALGPWGALTGPVRRGDVAAIKRHLPHADAAGVGELYRALGRAQVPLATRLAEAPEGALEELVAVLRQT